MAVLWIDGFETNRSQLSIDRTYTYGAGSQNIVPNGFVEGRFGGIAARARNGGVTAWQMKTDALGIRNTLVAGFAMRCNNPLASRSPLTFTGQAAQDVIEIEQVPDTDGFQLRLKSKGSTYYTSPKYDYLKWIYVEVWAILENPATQINTILRINGIEVFQGSINNGANTVVPGYTEFTIAAECEDIAGAYVDIDDFYLLDLFGTPNYFLGTGYNTLIESLNPESPGPNTEWTVGGNVSLNFDAVNEGENGNVNDDTNYNQGDNATQLDLHELSDLRFLNGPIVAVQATIDAAAVAGSEVIDHLIQSREFPPEELVSPEFFAVAPNYARARTVHQENPSSGVPFTPMELRDSRIGYGAKENFVTDFTPPDDPPPPEDDYDYGTTDNPSGTPLDFGTTSSPAGPELDFGTT